MTRKVVRVGNSSAVILSKDMKEHLGVEDTVDVQFREGEIVLRKPFTFEEAAQLTLQRYAKTYDELSR